MIDATFTMVDSGLFTELAIRLTREIAHVRSNVAWEDEFPLYNDRAMGSGLPKVEWIEDPYLDHIVDTTDVYVFPDIFNAGEQQLLKRCGKLVWGSNIGDALETQRVWFRGLQKELGMPVPEYEVVKGWTDLCALLKDKGHCFIKATSKIRGSMETREFFDFDQSEYWLWDLRIRLGSGAEDILFMVEEPIESPYETGIDTYCIQGKFPKTPMQGIEVKGKLILSSAQIHTETPRPMDDALSILAPELAKRGYCNFLSGEFRRNILSDFCARAPNPGIGVEMEMIRNIGEIIYYGAQGELVEPDFEFDYGIQAAVFHDDEGEMWKQFRIPDEVRRWFKLMEFCKKGDLYQIIPRYPFGSKCGWLLGVGNTIEEATNHLHENAKLLKDYPFDIKMDCLEEAVKQAHALEDEGMEFADQELPEPESVRPE